MAPSAQGSKGAGQAENERLVKTMKYVPLTGTPRAPSR